METSSFASSSILQNSHKCFHYFQKFSPIVFIVFIFVVFISSDAVPYVYNKPCIYGGDYYLSMRLFRFETLDKVEARVFASTCRLEDLKIVRNGHQHTKTTEDEEVFSINAYPPIEKHNKDLNTIIHLKNRCSSINVPSISWFVIINFNFGYVYITKYGLKG